MLSVQAMLLAFSGCGTALTTAPGGLGKPAPIVRAILLADVTPADRMKALEPFLNVGMTSRDAERALGAPWMGWGHGPGFMSWFYMLDSGRITVGVNCYPDGEVYRITYKGTDGESVVLRSDDPITWPKTTDAHNAKLREWMKKREK